ncbi:hypothetical protein CBER1_06973 [Cercospora berteroae]|uniref:Uncharacterized protein n=1 Tax=Cercospora berteroae TaxID=357750 RepID=A0A2S6BSG3_9PEZI|nr:hypothetical protein CBER1_06973 [Cercospora berteroae]
MRTSMFSFCLSIFASVALSRAGDLDKNDLEPRAIIQQADAQPAISQAPSVTTIWMATTIGTSPTYVPVVFTQTFASVPDQWPAPKSGAIGYGTLHEEEKRAETTPAPTAAAAVDVSSWRDFEKSQACEDARENKNTKTYTSSFSKYANIHLHLLATTTTSSPSSSPSPSATAFVIELQTLIHTVGVQPVIEVTELTEITRDITIEAEDENKPLSITSTRNFNDTRPTFPAEMNPEYMRTKLADVEGGGA